MTCKTEIRTLLISGMLSAAMAGQAGEASFDDLVKGLSAGEQDARQGAVQGIQDLLRSLDLKGRGKDLADRMALLRQMAAEANLSEDLRAQAKAALAPFLAGGILWALEGKACPGTVQHLRSMGDRLVVLGHEGPSNGWAALHDRLTGRPIWRVEGEKFGIIPAWVEVVPAGILIGGGTRERMWGNKETGWIVLLDPATGERIWRSGPFPTAARHHRLIDGDGRLVIGENDPENPLKPFSWAAALSVADGKILWTKREIPGKLLVMAVAGAGDTRGVVLGGFRRPEKKEGEIGGDSGWLAFLSARDGALIWSRQCDIPGQVLSIEVVPGGIVAIGNRLMGKMGEEGGLICPGCWMGGYRLQDGHPLWTRVLDRSEMDPPAFSAVPLRVVQGTHTDRLEKDAVPGASDWVGAYLDLDNEGQARPEPFDRSIQVVLALAALPDGLVASGGDFMNEAHVLRRYAGPERKRVWENDGLGKIDRLNVTSHGILAQCAQAKCGPAEAGLGAWFGMIDPASGRPLWKCDLNRGEWKVALTAQEICKDGIVISGRLWKETPPVPFSNNAPEVIEFLRLYRLCDADASPAR